MTLSSILFMEPQVFLQELGLSQKEITIYLTLLSRGPSSVRRLADASEVNRGTTYDVLKNLQQHGLVSYYHKEKKQYFVAEDPKGFVKVIETKKNQARQLEEKLGKVLPQLQSIAIHSTSTKPIVRYYHGYKAMRTILQEVLDEMSSSNEQAYYVYSSADIAQHIYEEFPDYTKQRIKREVHVNVISLGEGGGNDELSERKWLTKKESAPTYTIIFNQKVVFISLDDMNHPRGIVIDDANIAETQKRMFNHLWECL